jgi:two-component system chemotaxis response regulator CheB
MEYGWWSDGSGKTQFSNTPVLHHSIFFSMAKIRVLVVDDSVVIRRLVSDVLSADPAIEVIGVAANGRIALDKISQLKPDLVTMDVEMPELDGLQALKAIRKTDKRLPVVMLSTLTDRGAETTIEALSAGASDYVTKPSNVGSATMAMARIREQLIPKVKALCGFQDGAPVPMSSSSPTEVRPKPVLRIASAGPRRAEILAIGVSTGGPNALAELLPAISANFPLPIVIVQHMPPVFTRLLAERLNAASAIAVREGVAGEELKPGVAWIAPGDHHMVLEKTAGGARLKLNQEAPENSCRPAVDRLFLSVAQIYGAATLGVILTGMGQDGFKGCEQIAAAGGQILAQDEASSVVWGMPGFVARAGLAGKILPLNQIAGEVTRRAWIGRERSSAAKLDTEINGYLGR